MSWASRRKTGYIAILLVLILVPAMFFFSLWWYRAASCFDGVQNQGEYSIDRGGPCVRLDERQLIPYSVLWARPFMVRDGRASATAYIENPNHTAGVPQVSYVMGLYDEKNVLIAEREGVVSIMPGTITPVFVGGIDTGARTPARAFFTFTSRLEWERMEPYLRDIVVSNKLITTTGEPKVTAHVENESVHGAKDLFFVATVFDQAGNAFASSQTAVEYLEGKEKRDLTFTWREQFAFTPARVDVLVYQAAK